MDERAVGEERFVERGEFRGAELGRLRQQVLADERLVFDEGALQRVDDHAAGGEIGREHFAGEEAAVGEDELGGLLDTDGRVRHRRGGGGQGETVEREAAEVAEAPRFVGARGHGQRGKAVVGGALAVEPPRRERREAGEVCGEGVGGEGADYGRGGKGGRDGHGNDQ